MPDENENENTEEAFLTVPEVAERLSVTLPRLRRLLSRREWSEACRPITRQTRTGTRTSTGVPVFLLPQLEAALREGTEPKAEARTRTGDAFPFPAEDDSRFRALLEAYTRDQRERIEEQARTIADLRADKERLLGQVRQLENENERERERRFRFEAVMEARQETGQETTPSQERPERPLEGAETGDAAPARVEIPPGPSAGNFEEKRPWWRWW